METSIKLDKNQKDWSTTERTFHFITLKSQIKTLGLRKNSWLLLRAVSYCYIKTKEIRIL